MADLILREILLAFWKVHILHHAQERPIYGQWLLEELRRHGFQVSPGTLYPLLARMEQDGLLQVLKAGNPHPSPKARREYVLTSRGTKMLATLRRQVQELHHEVVEEHRQLAKRR
jgi:PadR family transcriptional regulator, regulatory protein PadR